MNLENENNAQPTVQAQYTHNVGGCHVVLHFSCLSTASDVRESIAKVLVMAALRQKDEASRKELSVCRVSTTGQVDKKRHSLAAPECHEFAKRMGDWEIIDELSEKAYPVSRYPPQNAIRSPS